MKFTKKNAIAIGAAVMMTASLATIASASTPPSTSIPVHSDLSAVEVVNVDPSTMDFSEMLEGTPVAVASIDPENVPCSLSAATTVKAGVASIAGAEVVKVHLDEIDFSQVLPGEPIVLTVTDADGVVKVNTGLDK